MQHHALITPSAWRGYSLLAFLAAFHAAAACNAETIRTPSPDGTLALDLTWENGRLAYAIVADETTIVSATPIGLTVDGSASPAADARPEVEREDVDRTLRPAVATIASEITDAYRSTVLDFGEVKLEARVADDGAAFRWVLQLGEREVVVDDERFAVDVGATTPVHFPRPNGKGFFSHQECYYAVLPAAKVKSDALGCVPLLFSPEGGRRLLVTDVNVTDYPGLWMRSAESGRFDGVLPKAPAEESFDGGRDLLVTARHDYVAQTSGDRALPWRVFVVSTTERLLDNTLCYRLAAGSRVEDASWITPGKVLWDWWHDRDLGKQPFQTGLNQQTFEAYVDFAAEHAIPYVLIDEGWAERTPGPSLTPTSEVDIPALVGRAAEHGIGVMLWMTAHALEQELDTAFDRFKEWGIRGIKVDFMQRDDQRMMAYCEEVARRAAEAEMIVIFHGGSKPTGLHREYPNVVSHESVLGLEQSKWGAGASPDMAVTIPFIRGVVGPVDYTPGAMDNFARDEFMPSYNNPGSQGTRCHQLAMYVVYQSAFPMLSDSPVKYARAGESFALLKRIPTTWDETRVLHGSLGEAVAIARRKGDAWYLAAMTNWYPRELACSLDFLGDGDFDAILCTDEPGQPSGYQIERRVVDASETLRLPLEPGGGAVVEITPR